MGYYLNQRTNEFQPVSDQPIQFDYKNGNSRAFLYAEQCFSGQTDLSQTALNQSLSGQPGQPASNPTNVTIGHQYPTPTVPVVAPPSLLQSPPVPPPAPPSPPPPSAAILFPPL